MILPQEPATKALPEPTRRQAKAARVVKHKPVLGVPLWFTPAAAEKPKGEKPARVRRAKRKNDPVHVAAARELRDRYLEHLNGEQFNSGMVLPGGKYEVCRQIEAKPAAPLLEQAA